MPHASHTPDIEETAAEPLHIRLFGPMQVAVYGKPLPSPRSQRGKWLLALLALRHDQEVERLWVAGTLWPDSSDELALAALRRTLTDLRRCLGSEAARIRSSSRRTLYFDSTNCAVDIIDFDRP